MLQISHLPSKLTFTSFKKTKYTKTPQKNPTTPPKKIMEYNIGKRSSWTHPPRRVKVRKMECEKCGYWLLLAVKVNKKSVQHVLNINHGKKS